MDATKENSIKDGIDEAMILLQTNTLYFVCCCPGYFGQDSYGSFERLFNSGDFNTGWEVSRVGGKVGGRDGVKLGSRVMLGSSSNAQWVQ
ncbi:MAG: hypothetical protein ACI8RD_003342 [Bacillariaceae sp.]|jgi:hypothetical protein